MGRVEVPLSRAVSALCRFLLSITLIVESRRLLASTGPSPSRILTSTFPLSPTHLFPRRISRFCHLSTPLLPSTQSTWETSRLPSACQSLSISVRKRLPLHLTRRPSASLRRTMKSTQQTARGTSSGLPPPSPLTARLGVVTVTIRLTGAIRAVFLHLFR